MSQQEIVRNEADDWARFDAILQENRRGLQLAETVAENPRVYFSYPGSGDPWENIFGVFRDDPYFEEWQEAIAENRRHEAEEVRNEESAGLAGVSQ